MLKNSIKKRYIINMIHINYDKFIVYTDGACRNNGKYNALSSIGIYFSNHNFHKINNVSEVLEVPTHTNNIAELTAINKSLSLIKEHDINLPIYLYTDSKYSMNILTKWYPKWSDKDKQSKKNVELIEKTYKLYNEIKPNIIHVKAHTCLDDEHSLGNALADQFANEALDKYEKNNIGILKYFNNGLS